MKKCLSIFLLITFFLNTSGYILLYFKQQHDIKKEMLKKISSFIEIKNLEKLTISKTTFSDLHDENEIKINGNMYDIVKKEDKGKYLILYCINDKKEEDIIKSFSKHFDDIKKQNNSKRSLTLLTFNALLNSSYNFRVYNDKTDFIIPLDNKYSSVTKKITSPPPRNTFV